MDDAKTKRRVINDMLDKRKADMLAAVEKMPEDWDETELQWFLVRCTELFYIHHPADRLRRTPITTRSGCRLQANDAEGALPGVNAAMRPSGRPDKAPQDFVEARRLRRGGLGSGGRLRGGDRLRGPCSRWRRWP